MLSRKLYVHKGYPLSSTKSQLTGCPSSSCYSLGGDEGKLSTTLWYVTGPVTTACCISR